jgi:uncharacterized protein YuzE
MNYRYDKEADIISWEIMEKEPIERAKEIGNLIIHLSPGNKPVLIEILNASGLKTKMCGIKEMGECRECGEKELKKRTANC